MKQKPQFLTGQHIGHDILVCLDDVQPFARFENIPDEIYDQIFRELLYSEDGDIDRTVMVNEEEFVRVKGRWKITVHPQNLAERTEQIRKAAVEYVIRTLEPGSVFEWPEEAELIEWNSESGGVHEDEISLVLPKNEGNVQVRLYDEDDKCMKEVNLSDFTTDGLIRIAECIHFEKVNE